MTGAGPGCVSEENGCPGVELVLLSCAVLCCAVLSSNAVAQYHAAQVGARGNKQATKSKGRFETITGKGSVLARRTEVDSQVRSGQVGWRRMPPGVCWLWAAIKNLGFCCRAAVLCLCLCFAAEKRLSAASKRANQRRPARRVHRNRTSSSHQSSLKPKTRDLSASRKSISPKSCVPATVSSPGLES